MHKLKILLNRIGFGTAAVSLGLAFTLPSLLSPAIAHAFPVGGQLGSRSIIMSDNITNDTGATYGVLFKPASSYTIKGIIVDFCAGDPIIGNSTCVAPTTFSVGTPTVTTTGVTTLGGIATTTLGGAWTSTAQNSSRTLRMVLAAGVALTSGTLYAFTFTGVHNPSVVGSFYARIITYTSDTGDILSYAPGTEGSTAAQDYGGIALNTTPAINITAKIQETLAFCVYSSVCSDNPSFTIGHAVGSATVIDTSAVDTQTVTFSISTNAQSGVLVRLFGGTLTSGANTIAAKGGTAGTIVAGTANFGIYLSALGTNMSATAPYTTSASTYALDVSGSGTTGTYGQQIAALSGPTNASISTITYGATASNTSAAGTYTATHQLIATGTF